MKITKIKVIEFSDYEIECIKERIAGNITESECAKRLNRKRQYINRMIAQYVFKLSSESKLIIK